MCAGPEVLGGHPSEERTRNFPGAARHVIFLVPRQEDLIQMRGNGSKCGGSKDLQLAMSCTSALNFALIALVSYELGMDL